MKIYYMNESGEINPTEREYIGGEYIEMISESDDFQRLEEQRKKVKIDDFLEHIERAAKIKGMKKFSIGHMFFPRAEHTAENIVWESEKENKILIEKAMQIAELRGHKFVGGVTIGRKSPHKTEEATGAWFFIEFAEHANPHKNPPNKSKIIWHKPSTWFAD